MATYKKRTPEFFTDGSGAELARVPLAVAGTYATLRASDMQALLQAGVSTNWCVNHSGYIAVNIPRLGPVPLARLIECASDGERVTYKDGNRLNLRGDNLVIERNHAVRVDIEALRTRLATERQARAATWDKLNEKSDPA